MRTTLVLAYLLIVGVVVAQPMRTKWIKHDYGFDGPTPNKVAQLRNGEYVVGYSSVNGSPQRAILTCYATDGATLWTKTLWSGTPFSNFELCKLLPNPDGSIYVVGTVSDGSGPLSRKSYLAQVEPSGATRWARTYGYNEAVLDGCLSPYGTLLVSGSRAGRAFVAQINGSGTVLGFQETEKPGFFVDATSILVDQTGRLQIALYAWNSSSWENGVWTVPADFSDGIVHWYSQNDISDFALAADGHNFYLAGINVENGFAAGSYIEKRSPDQTLLWRNTDPDGGGISMIQVDHTGKIVAYAGSIAQKVVRFDSSGNLISTVPGSVLLPKLFLDKYGRHYLAGSAFVDGYDEMQLHVVRGTQWLGRESNYIRRDSSGEGYWVQDTTMNQLTGDICIASAGYGPSIICLQQAPEALADAYAVPAGTVYMPARSVLSNDRFAADASAILASSPANGTVTLNSDGRFSYTPNPGFISTDSFSYRASKPSLTPSLATVSLVVK